MKKLFMTLTLALALMLCACAQAAEWEFTDRDQDASYDEASATRIMLSDEGIAIDGTGATADGSVLTISAEGTYILSGALSNGRIVVSCTDGEKVQLVLSGVDIHCEDYAALYVEEADKVFVTLAEGTENTLSDGADYALEDGDNVDATVFSRADITFNGAGTLAVTGNYNHAVVSKDDLAVTGGTYTITAVGHGLNGKDCVKISGGTFSIDAGSDGIQSDNDEDAGRGYVYITGGDFDIAAMGDGIQAETELRIEGGDFDIVTGGGSVNDSTQSDWGFWGGREQATEETASAKGLKAGVALTIAGGTFNIDSSDDALHSNGDMTISGGAISIASGDDGAHADETLSVSGGEIVISQSYEGMEAANIGISGGTIDIASSDDGLNTAGGNDSSALGDRPGRGAFDTDDGSDLAISGGTVVIDASGDGIDANGSIYVSGGEVYVNGPTSGADGAIDYAGEAVISGGTFIAVGPSGMAQNFSQGSSQCAALISASGAAGETVEIFDANGNVLFSFTPAKSYSSILVSLEALSVGESYTVSIGGENTATVTLESTITGSGGMGGMDGRNADGFGGGMNRR